MSPVESPTIEAMAESAVTALAWKKLITNVTGEPAPRPDGNLLIRIDIDLSHATALLHCQDMEHVRDHKPRWITFCADQDCLLAFSNQAVFGCEVTQLLARIEKVLPVQDDLKNCETDCDVYTMTSAVKTVVKATGRESVVHPISRRPPVIVVP